MCATEPRSTVRPSLYWGKLIGELVQSTSQFSHGLARARTHRVVSAHGPVICELSNVITLLGFNHCVTLEPTSRIIFRRTINKAPSPQRKMTRDWSIFRDHRRCGRSGGSLCSPKDVQGTDKCFGGYVYIRGTCTMGIVAIYCPKKAY